MNTEFEEFNYDLRFQLVSIFVSALKSSVPFLADLSNILPIDIIFHLVIVILIIFIINFHFLN